MAAAGGGIRALAAALALATLAASARAQSETPRARVYGLELERARDADRLLILADRPVTPRLEEVGPEQLVLHLANAELDPTAPRELVGGSGSALREARAVAVAAPALEVQIQIRRAAGAPPRLTRKDAIVALEFARAPEDAERHITFRLDDRPLVDLVNEVHRQTGMRFLYDDRLQGSATVIVTDPVTSGEALEILHSTLAGKGFAALPTPSGVLAVVPIDEGPARAPETREKLRADRAALITTLARFEHAPVETLVSLLQPAAGATVTTVTYAPTNAVILVGSEAPVHRWLELARALDEAAPSELTVIRPRHRRAAELFPMLEQTTRDPLSGRARVGLWLDEGSNALIVRATPAALASLREQLAALDVAPEAGGRIAVIHLRFADAKKLAETLRSAASGAEKGASASALAGRAFTIAVDEPTRALLVSGDADAQRAVRDAAEALDREPPNIEIELQVVEVTTDRNVDLGFDAFLPTADPGKPGNVAGISINDPFNPAAAVGFGRYVRTPVTFTLLDPVTGLPVINPVTGLPVVFELPREIADVRASERHVVSRTIMRPHLMTASGEEQELTAGLNVPVPTAAAPSETGAADPLETRVNVERQDIGLRLRVKPVAGEAGDVTLTVDVEVSNLREVASAVASVVGPVVQKRTLHANAVLASGGAAVLGMLLDGTDSAKESGPPFVKDAPVVGRLLKETADARTRSHLVIAIQARKLRSVDERIADAIRLRTAHERGLARRSALRAGDESWALVIGTRTQEGDAEALANAVGEIGGQRARVARWSWDGAERFDVALPGFRHAAEALAALNALEAKGFSAELVAVPAAPADGAASARE